MQKLKLTALLLISIVALSGCSKAESTATTEKADRTQSATAAAASEDLYSMEYRLCTTKCPEAISQIVTWGKPTEVGIVYYDGFFWNNTTNLAVSMDKLRMNSTYFLVKSKGTAPALKKPLGSERFAPVEVFYGAGVKNEKPNPITYGRIEIISIRKIPNPTPGKEYLTAMKTLGSKMRGPYTVSADRIEGYFSYSLDRPEIKPQQVEPITLQEGQQPQVIPVKAW
jgi:hypothetical protein